MCLCCAFQGVFVLVDNSFAWVRNHSSPEGGDTRSVVLRHLAFPCGMIRGALAAFGIDCVVTVEVNTPPQCARPPSSPHCVVVYSMAVIVCVCVCRHVYGEGKRLNRQRANHKHNTHTHTFSLPRHRTYTRTHTVIIAQSPFPFLLLRQSRSPSNVHPPEPQEALG